MPSLITHQLIASDASEAFPPNISEAVKECPDYFFLGAQGPDPFFFLRLLSSEKNLGKVLHADGVFETFCFFRDFYHEHESNELCAYLAGYVSHYATDAVFHPYVYSYLAEHKPEGMAHQGVENDWDVYFLRSRKMREAENYEPPFRPKKIALENILFPLIDGLSRKKHRRALSERAFCKCLKRFYLYAKVFRKNCYLKQRRWERLERALHLKPRLSGLYPRKTPAPLPNPDGADAFYEQAVTETARLVNLFFSGEPLLKTDFGKNLYTGLL